MNATTNYQLNQWDASDRVLRTDFNADNAKIEAALKAIADQAQRAERAIEQASYREYNQMLKQLYAGQNPEQPTHILFDAFLDNSRIASTSEGVSVSKTPPGLRLSSPQYITGTAITKPYSIDTKISYLQLIQRRSPSSAQGVAIRWNGTGLWVNLDRDRVNIEENLQKELGITDIYKPLARKGTSFEIKWDLSWTDKEMPQVTIYDFVVFLT